ncbi:hypothetical protein EON63_06390 [archaeon]|nr:MAG: hypothetical protein EON63_06390 [archaeon]
MTTVDSPVKRSLLSSCSSPYASIKKPNVLGETIFPFPSSPLPHGKKRPLDNIIGSPSRSSYKLPCSNRSSEIQGVEDRFIPNRARMDDELAYYAIMSAENDKPNPSTPNKPHTPAQLRLSKELSNLTAGGDKRILECRKSLSPVPDRSSSSRAVFSRRDSLEPALSINKPVIRSMPSQPKKILDVPNLMNDYYLNPLHWGSRNAVAVALGNTVYVWHADTGQVDSVLTIEEPEAYIGGVQWSPNSAYLCVGSSLHSVYVYDVHTETIHREMEGHTNRVVSIAWQSEHVVTTGSRDCAIHTHDIRARRSLVAK